MNAEPKRIKKENRWGDSQRFYFIEQLDVELPSVTTILKTLSKGAALDAWIAKVEREMVLKCSADLFEDVPTNPKMSRTAWITTMTTRLGKEKASQKELRKAGDIGTQAHALIEWQLRASLMQSVGHPPAITPKAQWAVSCWEKWKQTVSLKPILIEQRVWSIEHGFAGTADLLAEVNGKLTLLDWKTGKRVYPEAFLQNAAYRTALREMGHLAGECDGLILRLPKNETDPEFEAVPVEQPEKDLVDVFKNIIAIWKWQQSCEKEPMRSAPETAEAVA